ncbi:type IV toxin-antitoxin system AbiEi family antitoxin domain-containing protein [Labilibacter sediminis]|nr:type IV toxin-antitoxin system AbiEi family antitoxin domain-containing protein [Labilibacter sediminis]
MIDTESNISRLVKSKPRGVLLFPDDFNKLGTPAAIRKALQRLREKGFIRQVAHGIYVRPKISELIGEVMPTAEEVAQGIAKRDKIKLVPTGTYALNALGLSTQVPMNLVFLTDGAARTVKVGKRTIKLKRTTPKNLLAKGEVSSLVIQALREIGKDKPTEAEIQKIVALLKKEDKKILMHDIDLAPAWIKVIMQQAIE